METVFLGDETIKYEIKGRIVDIVLKEGFGVLKEG